MPWKWNDKPTTRADLRSTVAEFKRDERGTVTYFAIFMLMMMLLVGGIAVDLMQNEMTRTRVQNTLDRAVLAAADLDQPLEPDAVVADYFNKAGMGNYLTSVAVDQGINYRTVEARADATTHTQFMRLMGVPILDVPARSGAEERVQNVEISMVLDISGSMATNNKMQNLRDAADVFIDTVLTPDTQDLVSVTLVPYSEHVNVGEEIFDSLNTVDRHDFSYCLEIPNSEFSSTSLNTSITYDQMQHYQWNFDGYNNDRTDTVCPRYDYEEITLVSNNPGLLKGQVAQMQPRAGTSIFLGMKWAVAFLDPSTRDLITSVNVQKLAAGEQVITGGSIGAAGMAGRPKAYNDPETLKTIILMTDGEHDKSMRISSSVYANANHYAHWNNYNFNWYLSNYVPYYYRSSWYWEKYNKTTGDTLLDNICDAAKAQGIIIWTIGFEVEDHGANVMTNCASSPSHFFRVEGVEISEAFEAIAKQINQLRLTQ